MRQFTKEVLKELDSIYNYDFSTDNKELIMALFMQMFSYKYDDKIDNEIKFRDIESIVKTVWVPTSLKKKVGQPIFLDSVEENKFKEFDINEKTMYIFNEIRGSIVHGAFSINEDGTITITDKAFQMTFEFNCIIDICLIIVRELDIRDAKVKEVYDFIEFIRNLKNNTDDYNGARLDYSFLNLKYPVTLFNLLPMNEDDFHNDREYSDFIVSLFAEKEYYKNGNFKNNKDLEVRELYKLRNCIAHGQYYFTEDSLILFDYKDTFTFELARLNELFGLNKRVFK